MPKRLSTFIQDERAAMTLEFVLWIPIIVALLMTLIDATSLYVTHTEMWNVARDTARRMVTGKVLSEAEAEAYAAKALYLRGDLPYYIAATYDETMAVQVLIVLSTADMSILGIGSPMQIFGTNMEARVLMRPDPRIPFGTGGS